MLRNIPYNVICKVFFFLRRQTSKHCIYKRTLLCPVFEHLVTHDLTFQIQFFSILKVSGNMVIRGILLEMCTLLLSNSYS